MSARKQKLSPNNVKRKLNERWIRHKNVWTNKVANDEIEFKIGNRNDIT